MSKLIFMPLMLFCLCASAQKKFGFASQNFVGLDFGQHGTKPELRTIDGIQHKDWFWGLGTGIDYYYIRSIPAFVSVAKDFANKGGRNFFLAGDLGMNFDWSKNNTTPLGYNVTKSHDGIYWGASGGYKIAINPRHDALLLKLGYSYKFSSDDVQAIYYVDPFFPEAHEKYSYHLRRFSMSIGWKFM